MKLRELLNIIQNVGDANGIADIYICGGTVRDKLLGIIGKEISDLDITTGDKKVYNLATEFSIKMKEKYAIQSKTMDDGHTSVFIGNYKVDFSSGFIIPQIDEILHHKGIQNPTDLERESWSRDFTCNALMMTLDLKKITDPTKLGLNSIKEKVLRTCLDPDTTFRYNTNRIIRTFYLAAKLNFTVDENIIDWIKVNKSMIKLSSDSYLSKNINKGLNKNPKIIIDLINKTNIWDVIPITDKLIPYYKK